MRLEGLVVTVGVANYSDADRKIGGLELQFRLDEVQCDSEEIRDLGHMVSSELHRQFMERTGFRMDDSRHNCCKKAVPVKARRC